MPDSVETDQLGPREAHVHGYQPMGQPDDPNRQPNPNGLITITGWFTDEDTKYSDDETFPQWERWADNHAPFDHEYFLDAYTDPLQEMYG